MSNSSKSEILRDWFEIALFIAVVIADAYGLVPISQIIFLLPLVWLVLWLRSERWSAIGFTRSHNLAWSIAIGALAGVLMELFAVFVTTPLISKVFGVEPDYSAFRNIRGNLTLLLIFLGLSWTLAAFREEICF